MDRQGDYTTEGATVGEQRIDSVQAFCLHTESALPAFGPSRYALLPPPDAAAVGLELRAHKRFTGFCSGCNFLE
jgi:hypothetical protein